MCFNLSSAWVFTFRPVVRGGARACVEVCGRGYGCVRGVWACLKFMRWHVGLIYYITGKCVGERSSGSVKEHYECNFKQKMNKGIYKNHGITEFKL